METFFRYFACQGLKTKSLFAHEGKNLYFCGEKSQGTNKCTIKHGITNKILWQKRKKQ